MPPIPWRSSAARPTRSCRPARRPTRSPGVTRCGGSGTCRRGFTSATTPPWPLAEPPGSCLEVALESARADGPVLDLGCGPGQIAAIAASWGLPAIGVDVSLNMLAVARRRVPQATFIAGDARALPLASRSCRAVAAFYWFHHVPRPLLPAVLAEARRVLRPGGTLVIAAHLGAGERWVTKESESLRVTLYGRDELAGHVRDAGFDVESVGTRVPRPDEFQAEHGVLRARLA